MNFALLLAGKLCFSRISILSGKLYFNGIHVEFNLPFKLNKR